MSGNFYHSAEIRWFFLDNQDHSKELLNWFTRGQKISPKVERYYNQDTARKPYAQAFVKQETVRADRYLLFPDCDTVGVKQRQGKLEVKTLVMDPRPFRLTEHGIIGRIDQWVKWSLKSERAEELEVDLDQNGLWRKVVKSRYLQKYSFDSGQIVAVSPEQRPDTGCNIELTRLTVNANPARWLTVSLESFGPSAQTVSILALAAEHFFATNGSSPIPLDGRASLSYPSWLTYCFNEKLP